MQALNGLPLLAVLGPQLAEFLFQTLDRRPGDEGAANKYAHSQGEEDSDKTRQVILKVY
jgi:hypothetical protein